MILIKVMGGLGNQMQQYALYEKFRRMGKEAKLDISWFEDAAQQENVLARRELELKRFEGMEFETCTAAERQRLLGRGGFPGRIMRRLDPGRYRYFQEREMYHPEIFAFTDKYLEGHWACEKYYADILPLLRKKIRFPNSENNGQRQIIEEENRNNQNSGNRENCTNSVYILKKENIQSKEVKKKMMSENSVSIHIRRGDYLDPANAGMFGGICTEEYYRAAEDHIRERVGRVHFYLFSDDVAYLREKYHGEEYTIVDWNRGGDSFYDMELMSLCKHNICANSTFSFWGARLNGADGKIMIRPARHKNSQSVDPETMHRLWEGWMMIDEKGNVV